ncbi:Trypsin [Metarhizium brunneum]|uniref:Trypsin n=1 Tax=Metarhizium brunneum TaxID=500148 RepID=A0A7D5V0Z0_9HYPO|nr:Trypsin [Metarhizium brunneum]
MVPKAAILLAAAFSAISAATPAIDRRDNQQHCGGSLLDRKTVLTAGHCLLKSASVKAGTLNVQMGGVDARVASYKLHPKYIPSPIHPFNDIGIIKLSTPIVNSSTISYAILPESNAVPPVDSIAAAAGWGRQAPGDKSRVDKLGKITVPIKSPQYCVDHDPEGRLVHSITGQDTVCAGESGKTLCYGDSGGPLIDQQTGTLIGVASKVLQDAKKNYCGESTVFTRVSSFIPFITENLEPAPLTDAEIDDFFNQD